MTEEKNNIETSAQTSKEINKVNQFSNLLETVGKALPLGYSFLVFCGALYLYTFYSYFNIAIFQYLDVSEILLSFINFTFYLLPPLVIIILFFYLTTIIVSNTSVQKILTKLPPPFLNSEDTLILLEVFNRWGLHISIFLCSIYLSIALCISIESPLLKIIELLFFTNSGFFLLSQLGFNLQEGIKKILLFIILLTIVCVVCFASKNVHSINESPERNTVIIITDTIITTNKNYYYIGRTNNYIFLYNATKKESDIIPKNQIKKISFINNK